MKAILTVIFIIAASGASAQPGRYVTTALPNGDIVITDSVAARIRKCTWERPEGYACSDWRSVRYSDD